MEEGRTFQTKTKIRLTFHKPLVFLVHFFVLQSLSNLVVGLGLGFEGVGERPTTNKERIKVSVSPTKSPPTNNASGISKGLRKKERTRGKGTCKQDDC